MCVDNVVILKLINDQFIIGIDTGETYKYLQLINVVLKENGIAIEGLIPIGFPLFNNFDVEVDKVEFEEKVLLNFSGFENKITEDLKSKFVDTVAKYSGSIITNSKKIQIN
jgi:hypothetical protein